MGFEYWVPFYEVTLSFWLGCGLPCVGGPRPVFVCRLLLFRSCFFLLSLLLLVVDCCLYRVLALSIRSYPLLPVCAILFLLLLFCCAPFLFLVIVAFGVRGFVWKGCGSCGV